MGSKLFLDTNVLVYAYDADAGPKFRVAQELLKDCWTNESGVISVQVLQEFYVTVTRKLVRPVPKQAARDIVNTYQAWPIYATSPEDVIAASDLEEQHSISFWDALIVIAAQQAGATVLVSEDLQDGRRFGKLTVSNPFAGKQ